MFRLGVVGLGGEFSNHDLPDMFVLLEAHYLILSFLTLSPYHCYGSSSNQACELMRPSIFANRAFVSRMDPVVCLVSSPSSPIDTNQE
jgi:hypothetical protein